MTETLQTRNYCVHILVYGRFKHKLTPSIQGDSKVGAFLSPANRASNNKFFFPLTLFRNMNNNEDTGCQSFTEKKQNKK